jgi:hypothetical protein
MGKANKRAETVHYIRGHVDLDVERVRSRAPGLASRRDRARQRLAALVDGLHAAERAGNAEAVDAYESAVESAGIAAAVERVSGPWGGWCLVLDTETTTDTRQALRFGFYEVHGIRQDERTRLAMQGKLTRRSLDTLHQAGVFYSEAELSAAEVRTIQEYAAAHGLRCMSRDTFVAFFYQWARRFGALVIAHNAPFDLSRLATRWTRGGRGYRNVFALRLCDCEHRRKDGSRCRQCFKHPAVSIKSVGHLKAFIQFESTPLPPAAAEGAEESSRYTDTEKLHGRFLDTATLAAALLGAGTSVSLENLGRLLDVPPEHRKLDTGEHGATLTAAYLDYARRDVDATWWVYTQLRDLYDRHALPTPIWKIYSEASIGKAYLAAMGITPILARLPDFPQDVLGYGMAALYGARVEMRERLRPVEVEYADFLAEYSTVNALLGLQDLLLAREIHVRRGPEVMDDAQAFLRSAADWHTILQRPDVWRQMRVFCLVRADHDRLPYRGNFGPAGRNVALPLIEHGLPTWYALPDVLASALLTGKAPDILDAVELVPSAEKIATHPLAFFGDAQHTIDPQVQDIFGEVISLRREVKEQRDTAKERGELDEAARLDAIQLGLKLTASGTAYGIYVEVDEEDEYAEAQPVTVHALSTWAARTKRVEVGGSFYFPPIGALITAGGRLLLALAEKLAADQGLGYAMMDTDALALVRPDDMPSEVFYQRAREVRAWFDLLSPYRGQPPLLELEKQNIWPEKKSGQRTPLYFLGIADKRYALYNLVPNAAGPIERDGVRYAVRIRKFSSHGLGVYRGRGGYQTDEGIPEPHTDVNDLGGPRWCYDLWYRFIVAVETGQDRGGAPLPRHADTGAPKYFVPTRVDQGAHPWHCEPAYYQVTVSTWHLLKQNSADYDGHLVDLRPFSFFTLLPGFDRRPPLPLSVERRRMEAEIDGNPRLAAAYAALPAGQPFIGPYARTPADIAALQAQGAFNWYDTKQQAWQTLPPNVRTPTLAEGVREYYQRPAYKSPIPRGHGALPIPVIRHVDRIAVTGKETNAVAQLTADETDDALMAREAGMEGAQVYGVELGGPAGLITRARTLSTSDLQLATGLPQQTIKDIKRGRTTHPQPNTVAALGEGLWLLDPANPEGVANWRDIRSSELATLLCRADENMAWTPEDVRGVRNGSRALTSDRRERFIAAIHTWQRENAEDADDSPANAAADARDRRRRWERDARQYVDKLRNAGGVITITTQAMEVTP